MFINVNHVSNCWRAQSRSLSMYKTLVAAVACVALLGVPALAAQTKSSSHTAIKVAQQRTTNHPKNSKHAHHHKLAMNASLRGDREVRALNALEAAGYRRFANLHPKGNTFIATASKSGRSYNVTVSSAGNIQANRI
jgi:hypothetical protein